jgi:RHS repeat-associated protein
VVVLCTSNYSRQGRYRFGYQGQFAEEDEETGYNFFELRNYDPIVGRWISPDPYAQYWSPYNGMGNDPINSIDPDGGYSKFWAKWHNFWQGGNGAYLAGMDGNKEVWGFDTDLKEGAGIHSHFGKDAGNNYTDAPTIREWKPNLWQRWEMSDTWYSNMSYETVDALYVTGQFFTPWHKPTHIDGQEVIGEQGAEAFVSSAATLIPYTKLGKVSKMTAPQFSRLFKGTLSRLQPKTRGFINRQINKQVIEKPHRAAIKGTGAASTLFNDDN